MNSDHEAPAAGATPVVRSSYTVTQGDARRDRDRVLTTWQECGDEFSAAFSNGGQRYDWFYMLNPAGTGDVFFLEHTQSGKTVGFVGVGAREFRLNGSKARAGLLIDFIVHPDHRAFFPALLLQRFACRTARAKYDLLISYPNANAAPLMRRVGGFEDVSQVRFARAIEFSSYLQRWMPKWLARAVSAPFSAADRIVHGWRRRNHSRVRTQWRDEFDQRYSMLWPDTDRADLSVGVRDQSFLQWRFVGRQQHKYRILEILLEGSDRLQGYFVCEFMGAMLLVADVWLSGDMELQVGALLALVTEARSFGIGVVSIGIVGGSMLQEAMRFAGFSKRDAKRVLVSGPALARCHAWYLTLADSDV